MRTDVHGRTALPIDRVSGSLTPLARGRRGRLCPGRRQEGPMDVMAEDPRLPADIDAQPLVRAAAALRPVLTRRHDEIERAERLPQDLVEQLREAGFYRLVLPRALGGLQADPLTYLRIVERLA